MTTTNVPRRRRFSPRRNQQLVVFSLRQERFALPIQVAQRVAPLTELYGMTAGKHLGLMVLNRQQIPVLDIEYQIFGDRPSDPKCYSHVLILDNPFGEPMGVPLSEPPSLCRVTEGAFQPVPASYAVEKMMQCIAALIRIESEHPVFLIDPAQLFPQYTTTSRGQFHPTEHRQLEARHDSL